MSIAISDARISHVTRRNNDFQYRVHYARSRAHKIIKVAYCPNTTNNNSARLIDRALLLLPDNG